MYLSFFKEKIIIGKVRALAISTAISLFLIVVENNKIFAEDTTDDVIKPHAVYSCTSSGQVCAPASTGVLTLNENSSVSATFTTSARHCSDIKVAVSGSFSGNTDFLSAGQTSPQLFSKTLSAGTYPYSVKATGRFGGCNIGWLASWSGVMTFTVRSNPDPCQSERERLLQECGEGNFILTSSCIGWCVDSNIGPPDDTCND